MFFCLCWTKWFSVWWKLAIDRAGVITRSVTLRKRERKHFIFVALTFVTAFPPPPPLSLECRVYVQFPQHSHIKSRAGKFPLLDLRKNSANLNRSYTLTASYFEKWNLVFSASDPETIKVSACTADAWDVWAPNDCVVIFVVLRPVPAHWNDNSGLYEDLHADQFRPWLNAEFYQNAEGFVCVCG